MLQGNNKHNLSTSLSSDYKITAQDKLKQNHTNTFLNIFVINKCDLKYLTIIYVLKRNCQLAEQNARYSLANLIPRLRSSPRLRSKVKPCGPIGEYTKLCLPMVSAIT